MFMVGEKILSSKTPGEVYKLLIQGTLGRRDLSGRNGERRMGRGLLVREAAAIE